MPPADDQYKRKERTKQTNELRFSKVFDWLFDIFYVLRVETFAPFFTCGLLRITPALRACPEVFEA